MTSPDPHDPLVALWKAAPAPALDPHRLADDMRRLTRTQARVYQTVFGVCLLMGLLLAFEEASGRTETRGLLTAGWSVVVVAGLLRHRRSRARRAEALTWETPRLLAWLLGRARDGLTTARYLYAGAPLGALASALLMKALGWGLASPHSGASPGLDLLQTVAGVGVIAVMAVCGLVLARQQARQVRELTETLKDAGDL